MANPAKSTATTLAVILMSQLFSCQNQVSDSDNAITALTAESATVETEDKNKTLDLPDIDWEGREFRVLGYENSRTQVFGRSKCVGTAENGDSVNDADIPPQYGDRGKIQRCNYGNKGFEQHRLCDRDRTVDTQNRTRR